MTKRVHVARDDGGEALNTFVGGKAARRLRELARRFGSRRLAVEYALIVASDALRESRRSGR